MSIVSRSARAPRVVERTRPGAQAVGGHTNAVDADQRDDPSERQHRSVARDLRPLHARRAERFQELERERHVRQQVTCDLVGALAVDRRDALHARGEPGQRGQVADAVQAIEQEPDRAAAVLRRRFAIAGDRAEKGTRIAVAQAHLRRGAPIGDRAQRFRDRLQRRPRQANQLAPARRDARDDAADVMAVERRRADQQAVQKHAGSEDVALGGSALRAQHRRRSPAPPARSTCLPSAASAGPTASAITLAWPRSLTRMWCSCRS